MWKDLFDYSLKSNEKLIQTMQDDLSVFPERSILLLNHILNAHQIWNARILDEPTFEAWQLNNPNIWMELNEYNYQNSSIILANRSLDETIEYQNSKGIIFKNTIQDVLFHVINHSTYHRGQIALLFREAGLTPLITDYIAFKRNLNL